MGEVCGVGYRISLTEVRQRSPFAFSTFRVTRAYPCPIQASHRDRLVGIAGVGDNG
jgi:hypothetical protein